MWTASVDEIKKLKFTANKRIFQFSIDENISQEDIIKEFKKKQWEIFRASLLKLK